MKNVAPYRRRLLDEEKVNHTHRMLADAEMEIISARNWLEVSSAFILENGLIRQDKMAGASKKPGNALRQNNQHFSRGIAPGDSLRIGCERWQIAIPTGEIHAAA